MKKAIKQYCIFPAHIDRAEFSKEEYENLWWDQDEYPNRDDEDSVENNYYMFDCMFDTNDSGLINGETTEKYLLNIYDEKTLEMYPLVARLVAQNPPEYNLEIHSKRKMTDEEIAEATRQN